MPPVCGECNDMTSYLFPGDVQGAAWGFAMHTSSSSSSASWDAEQEQEPLGMGVWRAVCGKPCIRSQSRKLWRAWRQWSSQSSSGGGASEDGDGGREDNGGQESGWQGRRCSAGNTAGPRWQGRQCPQEDFQAYGAGAGYWNADFETWYECRQQNEGGGRRHGRSGSSWQQQDTRWAGGGHQWSRARQASSAGGSSELQASLRLLGLTSSVGLTGKQLKQAFHRAALAHHPDREGGDEQRFKEVQAAFALLESCVVA
eukprot:scaffold8.g1521.t1